MDAGDFVPEVCDFCDVQLKRLVDYEAHILGQRHRYEVKREIVKEQHWASVYHKTHFNKYGCSLCQEFFYGAKAYYEHLISGHPREPAFETDKYQYRRDVKVCRLCNIELRGRKAYSEHLRSEYHRCAIQYKELMKKGEYSHVPEQFDGRRGSAYRATSSFSGYQCQYCDVVHRSQEILDSHILSEHPEGIDE